MKHLITISIASLIIVLVGCGDEVSSSDKQAPEPDGGRKETQKVLAADAVGYDGHGIRKNLDGMLNENDKRNKELEEAQGTNDGTKEDQ